MEFKEYKTLSKKEFYQLFSLYKESKDHNIKEKLILSNIKLIYSLMNRFHQRSDKEDLFQVGIIGLIKAIDNFNIDYNLQFSTYAVPLIVGEMKRYIREDNQLKITRSIKDLSYHILKASDEYIQTYHRTPSTYTLSQILNVEEELIIEALNSTNSIASMQDDVGNDHQMTLEDVTTNQKDILKDLNQSIELKQGIKQLSKREQYIIYQRYFVGVLQSELSKMLNISQAQVSRIEKNALRKLHRKLS